MPLSGIPGSRDPGIRDETGTFADAATRFAVPAWPG
jgi:hypothetical protein